MLWSHPYSYQERPNGRPTFPPSWAYNKVLTSLPGWYQRRPSQELELSFPMANKKTPGHSIGGYPVGNLDFHPHQEIKSCPAPLFWDGVRESTAEPGFSPLPSGSMAIFTVVISRYPQWRYPQRNEEYPTTYLGVMRGWVGNLDLYFYLVTHSPLVLPAWCQRNPVKRECLIKIQDSEHNIKNQENLKLN